MCDDEAEGVHDAKAKQNAHARLAVSLIGAVPPECVPENDEVDTCIRCEGFAARLVVAMARGGLRTATLCGVLFAQQQLKRRHANQDKQRRHGKAEAAEVYSEQSERWDDKNGGKARHEGHRHEVERCRS